MMSTHSLGAVRVSTLLFPPAGLVLLWRSSQISLGRKIFGTVGVILYTVPYSALVVLVLHRFFGLQYEFRGGVVPRLTFHKTVPDYDALDASRAKQKQSASLAMTNPAPASAALWPGFRGSNRDGYAAGQHILCGCPSG